MLVLVCPLTQVLVKQRVTPACNRTSPGMKRDHTLLETGLVLYGNGSDTDKYLDIPVPVPLSFYYSHLISL